MAHTSKVCRPAATYLSSRRNLQARTLCVMILIASYERQWPQWSIVSACNKKSHAQRYLNAHFRGFRREPWSRADLWFRGTRWEGKEEPTRFRVAPNARCEKFTRNNQKVPLEQDSQPEYPFHRIAIDLYKYAGVNYIALIDAYSGLIYSERVKSKASHHIIDSLQGIFCRYGYPSEIRCDNNPFNSLEFEKFANDTNIMFKYSNPHYPQNNGLAEKKGWP
ncbi:Uncharacterized protein K02A2.6 [Trachymyrmex cornetzi]|uniref:Uncharacterized protein K02A2.6 n=1 Tax=Trachymyrmex cornetzi TaxID=471704 RepID=A0A195DVX5_9HYME|nr:Uncharacterized protein K02A2.6 [Trachymyrmex cornetzi]